MKCKECGSDGEVKIYPRKKKPGVTRVFRCAQGHGYIVSKAASEESPAAPVAEPKKNQPDGAGEPANGGRVPKTLFRKFLDSLGE